MNVSLAEIKQIPFFQPLSESEQTALIPLLTPVEKAAGEIVFRQAEIRRSLFFILKGRVSFTFHHDTGDPDRFEEIGPGQFFGEVATFTFHGQRTATATVTEALEAYELSREALTMFLREHPEAALHLMGGMAERLQRSGLQVQHAPPRNRSRLAQEELSQRERAARWVAGFAGSPLFLVLHALFFALWMGICGWLGKRGPDEYPFHLLGLLVGIEALVFSCFVLMNQYREDRAQDWRDNEEFEINERAEKEVAYLHQRLDDLHRELITRLPVKEADDNRSASSSQ